MIDRSKTQDTPAHPAAHDAGRLFGTCVARPILASGPMWSTSTGRTYDRKRSLQRSSQLIARRAPSTYGWAACAAHDNFWNDSIQIKTALTFLLMLSRFPPFDDAPSD